jgi:tetratricopeptide (TPR) repeat protein
MIEIPLMCHEDYPSLTLRARKWGIDRIRDMLSCMSQQGSSSNTENSIEKIDKDANDAYNDFERHGKLERLEQAIIGFRTACDMLNEADPQFPTLLNSLGACIRRRFEQLGNMADLNESIARSEEAVNLTPEDDPSKPLYLNNLGTALMKRFERLGNAADIDNAITYQQAAVSLTPEGDPNKPRRLHNLAASVEMRFERLGNVADLNNAIALQQSALNLIPDGHLDMPQCLNNLGGFLEIRFEQLGNLADLDNAITSQQAAVDITPHGHPDRPMYLNNLGASFEARFKLLGSIADVDNAIIIGQAAVDLTPEDHPDRPTYLNNLGNSFRGRFKRFENPKDLDNAITSKQAAVHLTPDGHPDKPARLNNLGTSLHHRFKRFGNLADLDSAIASRQAAVTLTPDCHTAKPGFLSNLGVSLQIRFEQLGRLADIDNAIASNQAAVTLTPDRHPGKPTHLTNLGRAFWTRSLLLKGPQDVEEAISHLSAAATSKTGPSIDRFRAAKFWSSIASLTRHPSILSAYESAVTVIPLVAWLGLPVTDRHQQLVEIGGITRDAAATAISLEQYDKALEWLEQGRSIVWTQILQLRTPVDDLRDIRPDLAERLAEVSRLLNQGPGKDGFSGRGIHSVHEEGRLYRAVTAEWESLTKQVRSLPNFEHFLKPLKSLQLIKAAQEGPVVVLNIAEQRCDALALVPGLDDLVHIPLPNITNKRVSELAGELKCSLYSSGVRMRGERAAKKVEDEIENKCVKGVLAELWNDLVKPILDSLAFSVRSTQLMCLTILITYTTAQSRYASTDLVVCHGATCFPPDTRCRYI